VLNYREVTCPIITGYNEIGYACSTLERLRHTNPQKHNSTKGWNIGGAGKFPEIAIERHQYTLFPNCRIEDLAIRGSGSCLTNPDHVMAANAKFSDRRTRKILVREKAHQAALGNVLSELNASRA
jgi:hypothetical protein